MGDLTKQLPVTKLNGQTRLIYNIVGQKERKC